MVSGLKPVSHLTQDAIQPGRWTGIARARLSVIIVVIMTVLYVSLPIFTHPSLSASSLSRQGDIYYHDLRNSHSSSRGWEREERILICVPLRDAESHLPMFFSHLLNLTYPHSLIDLAFLVSDSMDDTLEKLMEMLEAMQSNPNLQLRYGEISIIEKDFGQQVTQDVESRHGFAAQASRRKLMARARNWLLTAALRPYHSWVYWRDVDVETAPFTILEDLMRHDKDVIVPNVWRPLPDWLGDEQPYDLNSWQESETALALADTLDDDAVIVEGYAEYATWRPHLAYLRDPFGDPDVEMEIDGMAKKMGYSVIGLPHYTIWHLYEPSIDDLRHTQELEEARNDAKEKVSAKESRTLEMRSQFYDASEKWQQDKSDIRK
jgi:mannan polymerase II complex ANP1 subunit